MRNDVLSVPLFLQWEAPFYLTAILVLFLYSLRYYIFTPAAFSVKPVESWSSELDPNVDPFVTILLPMYNERNVVDRLLTACTSLDYPNYEVIVIDDSDDGTTDRLEK